MNVHLGDLEEYVQRKLEKGGYGSAAEVIREALRKMRELETEEAIERRLESYVLRGVDQGPPDGVSSEEWDRRLGATRERMSHFVREGIDQARRSEFVEGTASASRLREKQRDRRGHAGE